MFEIVDHSQQQGTVIKVLGVGGAGGNAVDHMIKHEVQGVEFVTLNTDAQALARSMARTCVRNKAGRSRPIRIARQPKAGFSSSKVAI